MKNTEVNQKQKKEKRRRDLKLRETDKKDNTSVQEQN